MKNYHTYSVEDFVQDEDFRDWVQGQSRQESFWMSFQQQNPTQQETIRQAEQIIRASHVAPEYLSEKEVRTEVERFLLRAGSHPPLRSEAGLDEPDQRIFRPSAFRFAAAAALALALGLAWYLRVPDRLLPAKTSPSRGYEVRLVETFNPTDQPLYLLLSDSSEVVLSPQSSLRYPSTFTDSARVVFLTGEASFSVTHRGLPFLVRTEDMVTRVLGTKFVVSAFEKDRRITVQVISGKVSVYRAEARPKAKINEISGLILTANQAAIFEKEERRLTKTLVANPTIVSDVSPEIESRYDEVSLPAILKDLERSYGIAIQFDEPSFNRCKITATLANESLYEKLDMLCKTISASYQIVDGQVVISGKGCP